jgi:CelD/BcsL family acetyltransferase involved in cellulose biosynthesis
MRSASWPDEAPSAVTVEQYRGDLAALASAWESLEEPAHPGAPFRSLAWISAWWKHFSFRREPFVLIARAGARVLGLLPLYTEPLPLGGRRVALMGDGVVGSDYLGVVSRARDSQRLALIFARHLTSMAHEQLVLDGVLADDPLVAALAGWPRVAVEPRFRCPFIGIATLRAVDRSPKSAFQRYLKMLPDGAGAQWQRRLRWLERCRGFQLERLERAADLPRAFDALLELHRKRWASEGGSDGIVSRAVEQFQRDAAVALAERGWLRLYLMSVEGEPRAALYGFSHGERFAYYQAGFDPEWRQRSVGTALLGLVISDCFSEGAAEFDFLRGTESYKLKWATGARETVRVRGRDASLRGWMHEAGHDAYWRLRAAGKRALPAPALAWARWARRKVRR